MPTMTLRRALEQSKNLVTARLLDGGIADRPEDSLDAICNLAIEAQIYPQCMRYYPFVLGAQPVRPIDLAAFYAAIYNEGGRPTPHMIESIALDGQTIYKANEELKFMATVDRAAMFQLRTILQGVVARGTAARLSSLSNFIGGKTGTSDEFNDSWFAGFSNDVTIAVWVGYDNAKGKHTLGAGQAGSRVALPIFDSVMKAVWALVAPQTVLVGPSHEASRHLIKLPIDLHSGERVEVRGNRGAFIEHFRLTRAGSLLRRRISWSPAAMTTQSATTAGSTTLPGLSSLAAIHGRRGATTTARQPIGSSRAKNFSVTSVRAR
jgi:membrane carboxypeptidase/penicillin-binding protein